MKIVFIAGCNHSGSTLLDLLLSCHPQIVGTGEVTRVARPERRRNYPVPISELKCTCGAVAGDCPVWGSLCERVVKSPDLSYSQSYAELLRGFCGHYGPSYVLSDSSKLLPNLKHLYNNSKEIGYSLNDLVVVHLVRDVRGYAVSQKRVTGKGGLQVLRCFAQWYVRNKEMERFLRRTGVRFVRVGYEEVCLNAERALKLICGAIDVEFAAEMLNPINATGHLLAGNPMRKDKKKASGLFYDNRWFADPGVNLLYALLPFVSGYNRKAVYGNTIHKQKDRLFNPI